MMDDIDEWVRMVMRADGYDPVSDDARKRWARKFVKWCAPHWTPGAELDDKDYRIIGSRFLAKLDRVRKGSS